MSLSIPVVKYVPTWFPFATTQREAVACWKEALKQLVDPIVAVKRNAVSYGPTLVDCYDSHQIDRLAGELYAPLLRTWLTN